MSLTLDASQSLVIDVFNPGPPQQIQIGGKFIKGEDIHFVYRTENIPSYVTNPTQIVIPCYYDSLESITAWRGLGVGSVASIFIHCYIRQGGASTNNRVTTLFSGWISDANPVGFPLIDRCDDTDILAGYSERFCTVAPAPAMRYTPPAGMPVKIVGFIGSFVTAAAPANRYIGLGVVDAVPAFVCLVRHATACTAGATWNVFGVPATGNNWVAGNELGIVLPDIVISDPWRFQADVLNVQLGDAWVGCTVICRPYVNF